MRSEQTVESKCGKSGVELHCFGRVVCGISSAGLSATFPQHEEAVKVQLIVVLLLVAVAVMVVMVWAEAFVVVIAVMMIAEVAVVATLIVVVKVFICDCTKK